MTSPSPRGGALLSVGIMLGAALLGWWSYRGLTGPPANPVTTTTSSSSPSITAPPDIGVLARYIDESFPETEWYGSIVGYEPLGTRGVAVLTSLREDQAALAVSICRAVSFWTPGDHLLVLVRGPDDVTLAESPSGVGAEQCRARA